MFQSLRYLLGVALLVSAVAGAPFRPGHAQTLVDSTGAAPWGGVGLFGSQEIKSDTLKASPQWRRVLASFLVEQTDFDRCVADPAACLSPMQKNWRQMVQSAAKLAPREQLAAVNGYFNRMPYRSDAELYDRKDYWATPREFMLRSGDCEDYAIAKYFALRTLGFGRDSLRVVVLRDRIRGLGHAVLAVYLDDDILILDNVSSQILSHSRYKLYVPMVSMNETTSWTHVGDARENERFARQVRQARRTLYAMKD